MDSVRALFRRLSSSPDTASSSQPPSTEASPPPSAPQSPGMTSISLARFLLSELPALSSARPPTAPELALEPASPRPEEDCPICLAPLDDGCSRTPCLHVFHQKCLETYFIASRGDAGSPGARGKCPICRGPIHAPLPVEARAMSGRPIDVISQIGPGARCHLDRHYAFRSLGSFEQPGMLYVITSNDDRKTPMSEAMWMLECKSAVVVHLNFRSDAHLAATMPGRGRGGREGWLSADGWERNTERQSTVSTGVPNGPYSGPVFSKAFEADSTVRLMGSNTWEGVYFVFVETQV
mmetsp:Transcript_26349/g.62342  ORF Transcript_26349/g.62342 Transcript_26349/m.62342 type:complete len:294 (-) Transcript_26349:138-1019(-)